MVDTTCQNCKFILLSWGVHNEIDSALNFSILVEEVLITDTLSMCAIVS